MHVINGNIFYYCAIKFSLDIVWECDGLTGQKSETKVIVVWKHKATIVIDIYRSFLLGDLLLSRSFLLKWVSYCNSKQPTGSVYGSGEVRLEWENICAALYDLILIKHSLCLFFVLLFSFPRLLFHPTNQIIAKLCNFVFDEIYFNVINDIYIFLVFMVLSIAKFILRCFLRVLRFLRNNSLSKN